MPNNGIIAHWSDLEFKIRSDVTSSSSSGSPGTATFAHSASLEGFTTPDTIQVLTGIVLEVASDSATPAWSASYDGPGGPYSTGAGSYRTDVEIAAVLKDVKLYCTLLAKWRLLWDSVEIYVNGSLATTLSGGEYNTDALGPSWLPIYGIAPKLLGGCTASRTGLGTLPTTYSCTQTMRATATGGWRFKEDGDATWYDLPITRPSISEPTVTGCPFTVSTSGILGGSTTWGATINSLSTTGEARALFRTDTYEGITCKTIEICYDEDGVEIERTECTSTLSADPDAINWYETQTTVESKSGYQYLIPDNARTIERFDGDFGLFVGRYGFPETTARGFKTCSDGGVTNSGASVSTIHSSYPEAIAVMGTAANAIEDPLGENAYAPCSASHSKTVEKTYAPDATLSTATCGCTPTPPVGPCVTTAIVYEFTVPASPVNETESAAVSITFPYTVEDIGANSALNTYMWHTEDIPRYVNTWCNPHWHYLDWFENWDYNAEIVNRYTYWMPIRTQWLNNPALPEVENTAQRNSIISDLLEDSGLTVFQDAFFAGHRWVGVSRWQVKSPTIPDYVDLTSDSSSLFTSPDSTATFTFGASITVNPSATTCKVRMEIHSWSVLPFLYPAICDRVLLNWQTTNVSQVRAYWVSSTGERTLIEQTPGDGFTTRNQTYYKQSNDDIRYAGSWGQDFGNGVVQDTGTDQLPTGQSAAAMADPTRNLSILLLQGFSAKYIEFEIDVADIALDMTLEYPRWYVSDETRSEYWESGQVVDLVWPDGPGVRIGQQAFAFGNSVISPPNITTLGYKQTIVDALCICRLLFEGTEVDGGSPDLTTELTQLYDSYEGQAISVVDKFGISFLLPKGTGETFRFALVNSFSEVPPLGIFPRKKRSTLTWLETGTHGQHVWVMAHLNRYLVSSNEQLQLFEDTNTTQITATETPPSGWFVSSHAQGNLVNTEMDTWIIRSGSTILAKASPYHGYFAHVGLAGETTDGGNIWHDKSAANRHIRGYIVSGNIQIERSQNASMFTWDLTPDVLTDVQWSTGRVDRFSKEQTLWVICERSGDIEVYTSTDEGRSLTLAISLATGTKPAMVIGPDRKRYYFWIDGTAIKGKIYDAAGNVLENTFTAVASGVDDKGISVEARTLEGGDTRIVLMYVSSSTVTAVEATDGKTFS